MAEPYTLTAAEVHKCLPRLHEHLSKADADRLDAILAHFPQPAATTVALAPCLAVMAADRSVEKQLADFRAFRQRLRQAARKARVELSLEVDSKKRSAPAQRLCWFAGRSGDRTVEQISVFSAEQASGGVDLDTLVPMRAEVSVGPTQVQFFVAYDVAADGSQAQDLLKRLQGDFKASKKYECTTWDESKILVGEHRVSAFEQALEAADFGLLLLSASWLGNFDQNGSLGVLVRADGKPVMPVVLKEVDEQRHKLYGLEQRQLFRGQFQRGARKSFADCAGPQKDRFIRQLYAQIEQRLDRWLAEPSQPSRARSRWHDDDLRALQDASGKLPPHLVESQAREADLHAALPEPADTQEAKRSVVAVDALLEWALDPQGTPYCALLGEYGMGKTTTLKQLTQRLLEQRRTDDHVPLPIFIDLRLYSPTVHAGEVPSLETLLQEMLSHVWDSTARPSFRAEEILRLVREEGAILIFDGLDEKLVHLDETQGRAFVRTLWQALPPVLFQPARQVPGVTPPPDPHKRPGRLIFSCRSHYFKTLREQNILLRSDDRDSVRAQTYRAWILLPFQEEQIRAYLHKVLGEEGVEAALALFARVHNLQELAQRPYLLSLMTSQIGALEQRQASGAVVYGVTLYALLVEEWLGRDSGKHTWGTEDKEQLMEDIAAAMWRQAAREWPWRQVRAWLGQCLAQDAVLQTRYAGVSPTLLEEDFRTATFVLRPDTSAEHFRFAHTSLQEYFLARYLLRALVDNVPQRWAMPSPSPETLDFLGQLLATATPGQRDQALHTLTGLLESYQPQATDGAFRYWLRAVNSNLPEPQPRQVDLHGADLEDLIIRGRSTTQPLPLVRANLADTRLANSRFEYVDLSYADLSRAQATNTEFHHVQARGLNLTGANLRAAIWRHSEALELQGGATAQWYECQWIASLVAPATLPPDFARQGTLSCHPGPPLPGGRSKELTMVFGHGNRVQGCSYSPDGATVLSASDDGTLKLWEVASGRCLRTLSGHEGWVWGCSYSPDGATVLSASNDKTLKLWEVASGRCLRTLSGHEGWVRGCSYSPDGATVLSASNDKTLKLWEVASGRCLRTLSGHEGWVRGCSYSPDGATVLSASDDRTLKLWEVASGRCLRTLSGHEGWVRGCSYSPDGATVLSASDDKTLKLWEVASGRCLRTLSGHEGSVWGCSYSPDGATVLSASDDRTLKLWEVASGRCLRTLSGHEGSVQGCSYSPDGATVLSASGDRTLKLWEVASGRCLRTLSGHEGWVWGCSYSPDGATVLSASDDRTLKLWEVASGRCLRTLSGHEGWVWGCSYSPDGATVLSASGDRTLKLWEVASGRCLRTLSGHEGWVQGCSYSPDGATVLSASGDKTLKLWEVASGRCLRTLSGHEDSVQGCSYSPDGATVLSASDDRTLKLWEVASGRCLRTLSGHEGWVRGCSYSPDGATVLSASGDGTLKLWEVASGRCLRTLSGHEGWVWGCSYSPDGATVLSASHDRTLKLWEVASGRCLRTLSGHEGWVWGCSYSPDGATVLSASGDKTLKLWDIHSGAALLTLVHGPNGQTAALDTRQQRILAASPEAWRFLGWRFFDTEARRLRLLPAEHFGPLPPG